MSIVGKIRLEMKISKKKVGVDLVKDTTWTIGAREKEKLQMRFDGFRGAMGRSEKY